MPTSISGTTGVSQVQDGVITNADISNTAAIFGSKIDPNFGNQNIITTGRIGIGPNAPNDPLDINGSYTSGNGPFLTLRNTANIITNTFGPGIILNNGVAGKKGFIINQVQNSDSSLLFANPNSPFETYISISQDGKLLSPNGAAFYGAVTSSGNSAIMEQGTTANGTYIKYASGVQICFTGFLTVTDQAINTAYGTLFQGLRSWTYPSAFAGVPSVNANGQWGTSASWSSVTQNVNTTSATLRFIDTTSRATGTSFYYSAVAVGRWFV